MGNRTTADLYRGLATDDTIELPVPLLRRMWDLACRTGDEDLQVLLVGRPNAPRDLLPQFAALTSARARIAYLGRPDLPAAEVHEVVHAEQRVTVLAALAAAEATTEAVFDALAEQMAARGSLRIASALLESRRTPQRVLLAALAWFDQEIGSFNSTQLRLVERAVGRLTPTSAEQVARTRTPRVWRGLVDVDGLSLATRLWLVEALIAPASRDERTQQWPPPDAGDLIRRLLNRDDLQPEVMGALDALLGADPKRMDRFEVTELRTRLVHASGGLLGGEYAAREQRFVDLSTAADPDADPATLAEFAKAADQENDVALAVPLVTNPRTPVDAAVALVRLLDTARAASRAYQAQRGTPGRDRVRVAILATHPELYADARDYRLPTEEVDPARLDDFDNPAAAAVALRQIYAAQAVSRPGAGSGPMRGLLRLLSDPHAVAADVSAALPWPFVMDTVTVRRGGPVFEQVTSRLLALQTEHLAEDPSAWRAFEELAETFPGSLEEMFATVSAIVAGSPEPVPAG